MINDLEKFLLEFNEKAGYGSNNSKTSKKEPDESTTISYKSGDWSVNDNYFGGEPYGGRTIVFYKSKPYWIMVFYGSVRENYNDFESVYGFLKSALIKKSDGKYHFRGPKEFIEGDFRYKNDWSGNLDKYFGKEMIEFKGKVIYEAKYIGGLVDARKE